MLRPTTTSTCAARRRCALAGPGRDRAPRSRAWRLRALAGTHPLVDALLLWRKAERVATTYGYTWLDEHLGDDGRLRFVDGSDGAAGRMTASAGLRTCPSRCALRWWPRPATSLCAPTWARSSPGCWPRSPGTRRWPGPRSTMTCTPPVAEQLELDRGRPRWPFSGLCTARRRATAPGRCAASKLLTPWPWPTWRTLTGRPGRARPPYLRRAIGPDELGRRRTRAGEERGAAAARGRYGRNALVQGAAAELFKVWAVTVRPGGRHGAQIVLCLHDELLVHVGAESACVAQLLDDCLEEAVRTGLRGSSGSWPTSPLSSAKTPGPRSSRTDGARRKSRRPPQVGLNEQNPGRPSTPSAQNVQPDGRRSQTVRKPPFLA